MINGLDIPSYKKSYGTGLKLPGSVIKGKGCCDKPVKKQKATGLKILK